MILSTTANVTLGEQKQKQTNRPTYLMQAADLRAKTRKTAMTSGWSYICSTRSVSVKKGNKLRSDGSRPESGDGNF